MHIEDELRGLQGELIDMLFPSDGILQPSAIVDKTLRFQELLGLLQLAVEQSHKDLRISPVRSTSFNVSYEGGVPSAELVHQLAQLQEWHNFIKNYRSKLSETILRERSEAQQKRLNTKAVIGESGADTKAHKAHLIQPAVPKTTKDKLLHTNKSITSNLIRSNNVLQSSVLQSSLNIDELTQQTSSLAGLNSKFDQLSLVLQRSARMVRTIESSSGREKRKIYMALSFLGFSIAWVIWRRLLRGPIRLLFWVWFRSSKFFLVLFGLVAPAKDAVTTLTSTCIIDAAATPADDANLSSTISDVLLTQRNSLHNALTQAVENAITRIVDEL
ncbi:HEL327Cp [Eremothecium sinecaudum]|uniref:HEL327Cp n=1 Tax=Eremothecium sinecaudum TaxID=45286 RepID=A0A0X8HT24_9SACH|nr:HEL327Cp [Eremothecium sinecaudum]AMD20954.1 HEL327Cp [Eremothecium sinecaudum]